MNIAVFMFEGAEELDFVGPWEVLAAWAEGWPEDEVTVFTVTPDPGPIKAAKGLTVTADYSWNDVPDIDVLVYPGGRGMRSHIDNGPYLDWVQALAGAGTLMTSVCTGSLVFANAGLLDDGPATTHWGSLDRLATLGDNVEVRADDRYVDRGEIITAAGVSAGIDMALHLVSRLHSPERAREVRRYIQYDPEPPI